MSDFNNMFAEQVAIEESTGATQRILEAMLKRDQMEIQYRQQGISESQIAQFHEASTQAINEALEGVKGAVSRGWKGVKGAASKVWQFVKELFRKFIAFCKRVWVTIRNFFSKDEDFLKRYKRELDDSGNKKLYADVDFELPSQSTRDWLDKAIPTMTAEKYEDAAQGLYSATIDYKKFKGSNIQVAIDMLTKNGDLDKLMRGDIDTAEAEEKKLDSIKDEEELKLAKAKLKYLRARNAMKVRYIKACHKSAKSAIIKCIAKCKSVKESTINFMVESCCIELDRAYAFTEADDSREYQGVGDAWKKSDGAWNKMKAAGKAVWHNIIAFFKKCGDWIRTKVKAIIKWVKEKFLKAKVWWKGTAVIATIPNFDFNENQSIEELEKIYDKVSGFEVEHKESTADQAAKLMGEQEALADKFGKINDSIASKLAGKPDDEINKKWAAAAKKVVDKYMKLINEALKINTSSAKKVDKKDEKSDEAQKEAMAIDNLMADSILESYQIIAEAAEVDDLLDKAVNGDSMGVGNVNLAGTNVLQQGASNNPFALTYDKDLYSQTVDIGDEHLAGTVGAEIGNTETLVKAGDQLAHEFALLDSMF